MDQQKHANTKSNALGKDQVMCLLDLISKNKWVTSKATNATINKLKSDAWKSIAQEFSEIVGDKRRPEQLRLKWENLKKSARKRNALKQNQLKTKSGGIYLHPDKVLDTVNSILRAVCSGSDADIASDVNTKQEFSDDIPTQTYMRSSALDKDQIMCLLDLISKHSCLTSKCISAANNVLKSEAWKTLAQEFSELTGEKRNPEQLRMKWENLKKAARKRDTMIVENNTNTTSVKERSPTPDESTLDSVSSILDSTSSGFTVDCGGDANKKRTLVEDVQIARIDRDLAMTSYFQAKTEKIKLENKKLKLQIKQLQLSIRSERRLSDKNGAQNAISTSF